MTMFILFLSVVYGCHVRLHNYTITPESALTITECLLTQNVVITSSRDLLINASLRWSNSLHDLTLVANKHIIFQRDVVFDCAGNLFLKAGFGDFNGRIIFKGWRHIYIVHNKRAEMHFNPVKPVHKHKYLAGDDYFNHVGPHSSQHSFFLVNDVYDLANICLYPSRNFALLRDIDAHATRRWHHGMGFPPIHGDITDKIFSGDFNGNGFAIRHLYINRPDELHVGLFRHTLGFDTKHRSMITNVRFEDCYVHGRYFVGLIGGLTQFSVISDVTLVNTTIKGRSIIGGVTGTAYYSILRDIEVVNTTMDRTVECNGVLAGVSTVSGLDFDTAGCVSRFSDLEETV